jgi:hypothetical protein
MKKSIIYLLVLTTLNINGCTNLKKTNTKIETIKTSYSATYDIRLVNVETDKQDKGTIDNDPTMENSYIFKNNELTFKWNPDLIKFIFELENKSDKTIKIIWDNSAFIDENGLSHKIIHSGVKFIDRQNSQQPSIVIKRSKILDSIQPSDYIKWVEGFYGRYTSFQGEWDEKPIFQKGFSGESYEKGKFSDIVTSKIGKKVRILLALEVSEKQKEYIFEFEVKNASLK